MNQRAGLPGVRLRVVGAILGFMSALSRYTATVLAGLVLVAAGCAGPDDAEKAESRAAEEARRAAVVSEFERAVDEARYLRDDIAALREDMRAVRDAANDEVRRASRDAADLRDDIAAIRREMQELGEAAASEAERSAEEAKRLGDDIAAMRDELTIALEAAESAGIDSADVSAALGDADEYPDPLVYDDEIGSRAYPSQGQAGNPARVIYGPTYRQRPFAAQPRGLAHDTRRSIRSRDAKRTASSVTNAKPVAPRGPRVAGKRRQAPASGPAVHTSRPAAPTSRPAAPASRLAAPASRPAPVPQKKAHVPIPER